jgi:SH3 domain protein
VPVINGLTDRFHPCQLLADMQTYRAPRRHPRAAGGLDRRRQQHVPTPTSRPRGCSTSSCAIACPEGFEPDADLLPPPGRCQLPADRSAGAAEGADLVATDVWASMGQEEEQAQRRAVFAPYQVNDAVMARAAPDALFMHCLPAHRGEEVAASVIDGPQSVVWDEAENRLHAQKALLELLLYARVRIQDGTVGFVLLQELQDEPAARSRLVQVEERLAALRQKPDALTAELARLQETHAELRERFATLEREKQQREQELATIRHASANVLDITSDRERLRLQVAELTRARADLEQQNRDLKNQTNQRWFLIGAGVLGAGILMGLLLPHLRLGRRKTPWGSL